MKARHLKDSKIKRQKIVVKPASSQPVLYCMVCETEVSSIKTLELHTKGTDHQKNVQHKINSERLQNNWIRPTAVPGKKLFKLF